VIGRLSSGYLQDTRLWIFYPSSVEYLVSDDGTKFVSVGKFRREVASSQQETSIWECARELQNVKARYLKVLAKNIGVCPEWHPGKGGKAWIFVDEIVAE
jgi:hypothetical protein